MLTSPRRLLPCQTTMKRAYGMATGPWAHLVHLHPSMAEHLCSCTDAEPGRLRRPDGNEAPGRERLRRSRPGENSCQADRCVPEGKALTASTLSAGRDGVRVVMPDGWVSARVPRG